MLRCHSQLLLSGCALSNVTNEMIHVADCRPEERMNLRRRSRAKLRLLFSDKRLHRSEADLRSGVAAAEPSVPVLLAIKVGGHLFSIR